jgi:ATPase family protein associated with various cellular activities (AAA)
MEVAQKLPSMGRQPQNLPLSGELDRTRPPLAGSISRATERIGAIYSPTMRGERRSHFIPRQRSVAAQTLAHNLGKDLYRTDLNAVVSEYIGETEKNLGRVFNAAKDGHAVLFFDEADALFGKRTDVKDSHDRCASTEINYLLRRSEKYAGLTILATSNRTKIDKRLLRRFHFIIPVPQRKKLRHKKSSTC